MLVEPGFFRTELLTPESTNYAEPSIEDYAERTEQTVAAWKGMNGQQGGDPAKLANALVQLASQDEPPLRWVAGADAVETVEQKAKDLLAQADAHRELSSSLAHDDAPGNRRTLRQMGVGVPGWGGLRRPSIVELPLWRVVAPTLDDRERPLRRRPRAPRALATLGGDVSERAGERAQPGRSPIETRCCVRWSRVPSLGRPHTAHRDGRPWLACGFFRRSGRDLSGESTTAIHLL